jgi:hypothetical protein
MRVWDGGIDTVLLLGHPADVVPTRRLTMAQHAREPPSTQLTQNLGLCSTFPHGVLRLVTPAACFPNLCALDPQVRSTDGHVPCTPVTIIRLNRRGKRTRFPMVCRPGFEPARDPCHADANARKVCRPGGPSVPAQAPPMAPNSVVTSGLRACGRGIKRDTIAQPQFVPQSLVTAGLAAERSTMTASAQLL